MTNVYVNPECDPRIRAATPCVLCCEMVAGVDRLCLMDAQVRIVMVIEGSARQRNNIKFDQRAHVHHHVNYDEEDDDGDAECWISIDGWLVRPECSGYGTQSLNQSSGIPGDRLLRLRHEEGWA